ncbi:MAG: tRNA 2-thiouridine(34) synthase MnmA [Firmicutes bacterium]|nr:tRNA 2-thiouridine(34) synthase MnmA [Bacillota bacterium]
MLEKYGFKKLFKDGDEISTVVVGMSGGVDSSVSAYVLKWQGYNVIGLFMKNWEDDGENCPAEADFRDVKRVCEVIDVPYYSVNFARQYMDNVFMEFLRGLERGFTPNPDILCNREVKFGPFLAHAEKIGADFVATGHYAQVHREGRDTYLLKGLDDKKDQSYFLCGLNQKQLSQAIFPIGHLEKGVVRQIAEELGLVTAKKKDSTGICFIGERKFRDFMKTYFGNKSGEIRTLDERVVGRHEGLMYYTLGQRKGLGIGGQKGVDAHDVDRWFVVKKDLERNILYVNNGECEELFSIELIATDFNFIPNTPDEKAFKCFAKTRYRQPDQACMVEIKDNGNVWVIFEKKQRAVTPGQWVVLYDVDGKCLGGGLISQKNDCMQL